MHMSDDTDIWWSSLSKYRMRLIRQNNLIDTFENTTAKFKENSADSFLKFNFSMIYLKYFFISLKYCKIQ